MTTDTSTKPLLVDVTIFGGEREILHLRLAELSSVVQKFIIVECEVTFTNKQRGLLMPTLLKDDPLVRQYAEQIMFLPITAAEVSHFTDAWKREAFIRNYPTRVFPQLAAALNRSQFWFLAADLDEIPNTTNLLDELDRFTNNGTTFCKLDMSFHYYSLSWMFRERWNKGFVYHVNFSDKNAADPTQLDLDVLRLSGNAPKMPNAGWHLSYFLTLPEIQHKLRSFSHTEYSGPPYSDANYIEQCVNEHKSLFKHEFLIPYLPSNPRPRHLSLLSAQFH